MRVLAAHDVAKDCLPSSFALYPMAPDQPAIAARGIYEHRAKNRTENTDEIEVLFPGARAALLLFCILFLMAVPIAESCLLSDRLAQQLVGRGGLPGMCFLGDGCSYSVVVRIAKKSGSLGITSFKYFTVREIIWRCVSRSGAGSESISAREGPGKQTHRPEPPGPRSTSCRGRSFQRESRLLFSVRSGPDPPAPLPTRRRVAVGFVQDLLQFLNTHSPGREARLIVENRLVVIAGARACR